MSTEERELRLVNAVELKILGVANNEEKLQNLLNTYLAPLLLKAASPHAAVREKVQATYQLVHRFVKPTGIVLPTQTLSEQYKSSPSPAVKYFDILCLQHSVPRLNPIDRARLLPTLLRSIGSDTGSTRPALFGLILSILPDADIPSRGSRHDADARESFGLSDPQDASFVATWLGRFLLLKPAAGPTAAFASWENSNKSLSTSDLQFLQVGKPESENLWPRLSVLRNKIVELLSSTVFTDEEAWFPAICAAASSDPRLSSAGDAILRRSGVDWEDEGVVKRLYESHGSLQAAYRIKILDLLARSRRATTRDMDDAIVKVVQLDFKRQSEGDSQEVDPLAPNGTREREKLHRSLFAYLSWVAKNASQRSEFAIGLDIAQKMRDFVQDQSWPVPKDAKPDAAELRATAYGIIGALAARNTAQDPTAIRDLSCWLLESYSMDPTPDTATIIAASLSSMGATWDTSTDEAKAALQSMLLAFMARPYPAPDLVRNVRSIVVGWANNLLPYSNVCARFINVIAMAGRSGDPKDVSEGGKDGLDPWARVAQSTSATSPDYPDWTLLLDALTRGSLNPFEYMTANIQQGHLPAFLQESLGDLNSDPAKVAPTFETPPLAISLQHVAQTLLLTALGDYFKLGPDWPTSLDALLRTDTIAQARIRPYLQGVDDSVALFLNTCLDGAHLHQPFAENFLDSFLSIARFAPREAVAQVAHRAESLLPLVKSGNKKVQILAARVFGILAAHPEVVFQVSTGAIQTLKDTAKLCNNNTAGLEQAAAEGAILALAYTTSRAVYYGVSTNDGFMYEDAISVFLNGRDASIRYTAMEALGEAWTAGWSPAIDAQDREAIIARLCREAKEGNETAIRTLGRYAILEAPDDTTKVLHALPSSKWAVDIFQALDQLSDLRQTETHFSVGEAMSVVVARWDSVALQLGRDVDNQQSTFSAGKRGNLVADAMEYILAKFLGTKPSVLRAAGIWLFCLVQYCSHLEEISSRLRQIQTAFMRLLNSRDDLVQETAARGLTLVYERGDPELRVSLAKDLVAAFTGTSSGPQLKVEGETELFQPGMLPTGDGQSVTSYKDIVSIAQEVGDQSLVYKLMSIASNAARWSTRSAFDRFGLSKLMSETEMDPKLYPKLYRYRFDPNPNVRRSMDGIWKALVQNEAKVMSENFDAIMRELLETMVGKEWRAREASCGAVEELVSSAQFDKYEQYYHSIWRTGSRVLDDIKGSVRAAAWKLCNALSKKLVAELSESGKSKRTAAMLREVMPFLLGDNGVDSGNEESRAFAAWTVIEIAKNAQGLMNPYVVEVVPKLLGLLSTLELDVINFSYQRAGAEERQQFDRARSTMVRRSPMLAAVQDCLAHIDSQVMTEFAPKLNETIKSALGVPSGIGCAQTLVMLFTSNAQVAKPHANVFLALAGRKALGRNDEVCKSYANASAYIFRSATDNQRQGFLDQLMAAYFGDEGQESRRKVADVIVALSSLASDQFKHHDAQALPFVYIGSHDVDEYTNKAFNQSWSKSVGSTGRAVALHTQEICKLAGSGLDTTLWDIKHTCALTVGAMIKDVASTLDSLTPHMSPAVAKTIWPVLDASLQLKTFARKEDLLAVFPTFVEKAPSLWKDDSAIKAKLQKIAVREAKRNNARYRCGAYPSLWKFASVWPDEGLLSTVVDIVQGDLDRWAERHSAMDTDSDDSWAEVSEKLTSTALEAVARAWPKEAMERDHNKVLTTIMDALGGYFGNSEFADIKRRTWYGCVKDMFDAIQAPTAQTPYTWPLAIKFLDSLDVESAALLGSEKVREQRAASVAAICVALKGGAFGTPAGDDVEKLKSKVVGLQVGERSMDVNKAIKGALDMLEGW